MVQKQPEEQFAEEAEEMNMSKLDYHLDEYPHLLAKALIAEKGQVAFRSFYFTFNVLLWSNG